MIGPKITTVFRSRWNALFWAAGVLLTAYCSVPAADEDHGRRTEAGEAAVHRNPWSKDTADQAAPR